MKALRNILIAIPILFVLWIVALFNDLKLIPELKEDYYIGDVGLDREMVLMESEEKLTLQMRIPSAPFRGRGPRRRCSNLLSVRGSASDR